jgi:hypothetical protein
MNNRMMNAMTVQKILIIDLKEWDTILINKIRANKLNKIRYKNNARHVIKN